MSYGLSRIGTTLIPDKSKPTVTWGRKAMGQLGLARASAVVVARLPKESSHDLVQPLAMALAARKVRAGAAANLERTVGGRASRRSSTSLCHYP